MWPGGRCTSPCSAAKRGRGRSVGVGLGVEVAEGEDDLVDDQFLDDRLTDERPTAVGSGRRLETDRLAAVGTIDQVDGAPAMR